MKFPSEWLSVRLKDAIKDMQPGFAQRPGDKGSIPQIRTHNISPQGKIDLSGLKFVIPSKTERAHYSLQAGDVIFNNTNSEEWVGKTAVFKEEGDYVFSNHMTRIRVDTSLISPDFLAYYLNFLWKSGFSKQKAKRWVNQAGIDQSTLQGFIVPLPTLLEQDQLVDVLMQIDILRQLRDETLKLALEISQALFIEIFGPPDTRINQKWEIVTLGNIVQVETGGTPSRLKKDYFTGDINWAKSTELKDDLLVETEEKISNEALSSSNTKLFPKNTILVAMYGQGQTRGRTTILTAPSTCNQACAAILPSSHFLPNYLWLWFRCSYKRVRALGRGGQQENLNLNIIRNLKVPKPPMSLQKKFDTLFTLLNRQILKIKEELSEYIKLSEMLTIEAVTGDLTELWRHSNHATLSVAAKNRDNILGILKKKVTITEHAPEERAWLSQPNRHWLMNQLSELQGFVYEALREWKGTLIPSEDLETFREQAFPVEHLEDANDQILRALHQLAGLGLIAKISLYNYEGDYVTAFRGLREEELSQVHDRHYLAKG